MGGGGVDFFLFCSGIGLFYSLRKKNAIKKWYWNRYTRILVPFLLFSIPYYLFRMAIDGDSFGRFLCNITTISFWIRHEGAWFVAMLIPLYLFTPLLAKVIDKSNHRWIPSMLLCVFSIIGASLPTTNAVVNNIQMCLSHIPSFVIGYWVAKHVLESKEINWAWVIGALIAYFAILPFYKNLHVSSNWMMIFSGSVILVILINKIRGTLINRCLIFLGTISLESYLANIYLPVVLRKVGFMNYLNNYDKGNYLYYAIVILAGLVIATWGHQISNKILKVIRIGNTK